MELTMQLWQWVVMIVAVNLGYFAITSIGEFISFKIRVRRLVKSVSDPIKIRMSFMDYNAFISTGKKKKEDELMEYIEKEVRYDLFCHTCENNKLDDKGEWSETCESCQAEPVNANSMRPVYYKKGDK